MLVIKGDQVVNLDNVISFCKYEQEIKEESFFKSSKKVSTKFTIGFYFTASLHKYCSFDYESLSQRDIDYCKIIEGYNLNYRIVDL